MFCKHCGKQIDDDSRFCCECGGTLISNSHVENVEIKQSLSIPQQQEISNSQPIQITTQTAPVSYELPTPSVPYNNLSTFQHTYATSHATARTLTRPNLWQILFYTVFGTWGVSVILLFVDWFSVDFFGFYTYSANLFTLSKTLSRMEGDFDVSIHATSVLIFIVAFCTIAIILLSLSVFYFLKKKKAAFGTGIALSSLFILFSVTAIAVVSIGTQVYNDSGDIDLAGLFSDYMFSLSVAPYLLIFVSVVSIVLLLVARHKFVIDVNNSFQTYKPKKIKQAKVHKPSTINNISTTQFTLVSAIMLFIALYFFILFIVDGSFNSDFILSFSLLLISLFPILSIVVLFIHFRTSSSNFNERSLLTLQVVFHLSHTIPLIIPSILNPTGLLFLVASNILILLRCILRIHAIKKGVNRSYISLVLISLISVFIAFIPSIRLVFYSHNLGFSIALMICHILYIVYNFVLLAHIPLTHHFLGFIKACVPVCIFLAISAAFLSNFTFLGYSITYRYKTSLWYDEDDPFFSLCGISNMKKLEEFDGGEALLSNNDLAELGKCSSIRKLDLDSCYIDSLSPLENLTNLEYLNLSKNGIGDISSLESLPNLRYLNLSYNDITDISPLTECPDLEILDLCSNEITDVSALKYHSKLRVLCLESNEINDIESLINLASLTHLSVYETNIRTSTAHNLFPNLENLYPVERSDNSQRGSYHSGYIHDEIDMRMKDFVLSDNTKEYISSTSTDSSNESTDNITENVISPDYTDDITVTSYPYPPEFDYYLATSRYNKDENNTCKVEDAFDNNTLTCWQDGVDGYGEGEILTAISAETQLISSITIYNGYQKKESLYEKNSRVKKFTVIYDGGEESFILLDTPNPQLFKFDAPVKTSSISIRIDSVYEGSKYKDTCITDIIFG